MTEQKVRNIQRARSGFDIESSRYDIRCVNVKVGDMEICPNNGKCKMQLDEDEDMEKGKPLYHVIPKRVKQKANTSESGK